MREKPVPSEAAEERMRAIRRATRTQYAADEKIRIVPTRNDHCRVVTSDGQGGSRGTTVAVNHLRRLRPPVRTQGSSRGSPPETTTVMKTRRQHRVLATNRYCLKVRHYAKNRRHQH